MNEWISPIFTTVTSSLILYAIKGIYERFDKIDARFDKIDARFDKIYARFDKIDAKFEAMQREIAEMRQDITRIDAQQKLLIDYFIPKHLEKVSSD